MLFSDSLNCNVYGYSQNERNRLISFLLVIKNTFPLLYTFYLFSKYIFVISHFEKYEKNLS